MESSPKGHNQGAADHSSQHNSGRQQRRAVTCAPATQTSSRHSPPLQGPGAVENGSVTGNRQADTLLLMEVEEGVRDPGSIISGS